MFDPEKLRGTLDSLRSNAILLRGKESLNDVTPALVEVIFLRAHADLSSCADVIAQLAQEKEKLHQRVVELEAEQRAQKAAAAAGTEGDGANVD